jgi:hypothetical protein
MPLKDKELKDILQDNFESPSFGFNNKTLRLIEEKSKSSNIYTPVKTSKWILGSLFGVLLICIIYSFSIESTLIAKLALPKISIYWMWSLSCSGLSLGIWLWVLLLHKEKIKI